MIIRLLYFLTPRLILGILVFIFLAYGALFFYNEMLFPENGGSAPLMLSFAGIVSFGLGWIIWTAGGRLQISSLLSAAEKANELDDYLNAGKAFRRARSILLSSSHFLPGRAKEEYARFLNRYADFLAAAGFNDCKALSTYREYFKYNPEDENFARRIIPVVITADEIKPKHITLLHKLKELAPDSREIADFLASIYLKYEIYNSESQEVLLDTIRNYSPLRPLALKFLLPKMLYQQRMDSIAQEIYLESFKSGLEYPNLPPLLATIVERAQFEGLSHPWAAQIEAELKDTMAAEELDQLLTAAKNERIGKIPLKEPVQSRRSLYDEEEIVAFEDEEGLSYEVLDDTAVYKPGRFSACIEKLVGGLQLIPDLISMFFRALWKTFSWIYRELHRNWSVFRWILAGLLSAIILFGIIRTVVIRVSPPEQISLEVLSAKPFTIQVAAFKDKARAERFIKEFNLPNVRLYIASSHGETVWHQVRMGHYDTMEEAKKAAAKMGLKNYFIANFSPGTYLE